METQIPNIIDNPSFFYPAILLCNSGLLCVLRKIFRALWWFMDVFLSFHWSNLQSFFIKFVKKYIYLLFRIMELLVH